MKKLYYQATHLRSHTWKDVGGLGGLLLDGAFFLFLVAISILVTVVGAIAVALAYLFRPLLNLASHSWRTQKA